MKDHAHSAPDFPHDEHLHDSVLGNAIAPAHNHAHSHSHTHTNTRAVINRLSRIAGHINGVKSMVEEGRDCSEVLIQLSAVRAAVNETCRVILNDHIDHCIVDAIQTGDIEAVNELNKAIKLLMKG